LQKPAILSQPTRGNATVAQDYAIPTCPIVWAVTEIADKTTSEIKIRIRIGNSRRNRQPDNWLVLSKIVLRMTTRKERPARDFPNCSALVVGIYAVPGIPNLLC